MSGGRLPADPMADGIRAFGERLRRGEITCAGAVDAHLKRIELLEPALGAFEHVSADKARAAAQAMDKLLASGTDLGPLMGVTVAVKDLVAVDGMPCTSGSNIDVSDLVGSEGLFMQGLRRAGCIVLGKLKTVEFALGGAGTNRVRGTPRNPWDSKAFRVPGGSSSGSAVAMAAGMCGFAIGTDTGGSVRGPAAFCGTFGLKTTKGLWPTDGVFRLCQTFDSIGLLTGSAEDAAILFGVIQGRPVPKPVAAQGLRLAKPTNKFFDELDPDVEHYVGEAIKTLEKAGATIVPIQVPEFEGIDEIFNEILAAEFIANLGRERFMEKRNLIDRDVVGRGEIGLQIPAERYIRRQDQRAVLNRITVERFCDLDGWLCPTRAVIPRKLEEYENPDDFKRISRLSARNTHHASTSGLCAVSLPVQSATAPLPVGLHLSCAPFAEEKMLSMALLFESLIGKPRRPDLSGFLKA
jgi:aspartyl-tRNA(Asn)/glutamyl-tRNA(Gln) amidotransferase subunit A